MSSMKPLIVMTMCAVLTVTCGGCASGSGLPVPGFMSKWFGKKNDPGVASTNVSKDLQPWSPKKDNFAQKIGTSIGESSVAKTVSGTFSKASQKVTDSVRPKSTEPEDALSLNKTAKPSADMYVSVAKIQEKHGNTEEAIEKYKQALEIDPDHLGALVGLGRAYDRQNRLEDAMRCYSLAVRKHPHEPGALNDLALCYARQTKYGDAIAMLRRAVDAAPDKVLYRNNLATVLVEIDHVDEAIAQLAAVHGKAVAHYNVGVLLARRGQEPSAGEQFKLAAAADPSFKEAQQWLAVIESRQSERVASLPSHDTFRTGMDDGTGRATPASVDAPVVGRMTAEALPTAAAEPRGPVSTLEVSGRSTPVSAEVEAPPATVIR